MRAQIAGMVRAIHPELVERRRDFHRHPELGFEEVRTAGIVAEWLRGLGLEVTTGVAKTGVVARLRGARPGKTVAMRADLDGLPIQDTKTCDYASTVPGKMHACGHDAHTAMLLGAAKVLSQLREEVAGEILFLFQPAEEGPGGAAPMMAEGVLEGVDFILAQHVVPWLPAGYIAVADGPCSAAADEFTLKILGKGGHGAYPHMAVDAIQIAAHVIGGLQAIVSRQIDAQQTAVLSIGTIHGGSRLNVIADEVTMTGTVRTFDRLLREEIPRRMEDIVRGITSAFGAGYEFTYTDLYPALHNHHAAVELIKRVGREVLGSGRVLDAPPSMGAEDFAYYLQKVPGCMYWLGCKAEGHNLHHPAFDIDEEALFYGTQLLVEGALAFLLEA
ncbi:MAG: amidohydrolase [Tumebacillaceae bacterium]